MELLVLAVLLVLVAPVLAIAAVWRQRGLRLRIEELARQTSQQNDALHRELLELRRQIAVLPQPLTHAASPGATGALASIAAPKPPAVPTEKPAEPAITVAPDRPPAAPVPAVETGLTLCPWCSTVHAWGISNCPKPVVPSPAMPQPGPAPPHITPVSPEVPASTAVPLQLRAPVAEKATEEIVAANMVEIAGTSPPAADTSIGPVEAPVSRPPATPSPLVKPTTEHDGVAPTHTPVAPPVPIADSVAPPMFASTGPSSKEATARRMKSVFALEETLGTNWLNKLGITILVLGLALFGIYELGQLGPAGKVSLSFFVSLVLLGGGIYFERQDRYHILGRTLIGGGWALLFFTIYALNHVEAMRVMGSETTDLILMLATALAMVLHTLRYRSQLVTGLAFLLAYSTVSLSHDDVYSLASGVVLAVGLVSIVTKMGWFELEVFGILSSYLTHLYWLYRLLGPEGAQGHAFSEYRASTALLLFYWLVFRASYIVRKVKSPAAEHMSTAAALLNTLLLLGTMKFQSVQPQLAFLALLTIGATEFSFGQLPPTRRRREAFVVLSALGAALMLAAVPFRYSGNNVAVLWLVGGEVFLIAGVSFAEVVFRRIGLLAGLLVALHLVGVDLKQLVAMREAGENMVLASGVIFALCAVVFYFNSLLIGDRWKALFSGPFDAHLVVDHSYAGGFAAAVAAWAFCTHDWMAVALASIMLTLAVLGRKFKSVHLQVQYGIIGLLAAFRVLLVNLHSEAPSHSHISTRLITLPVVAGLFYACAKFAQLRDDANQRSFRGLFAIAGTAVLGALIYFEVPELWQSTATIVFAVALLEVGQRVRYHALAWHAHLLSASAVVAALTGDQTVIQRWHSVPLYALGALPVVLGLYWTATRIAVSSPDHIDRARAAYSWVGTGVMLWFLNEAVPRPWIAVSWIAFAVAIALVLRRTGYRQLASQANVVAAFAVARGCGTNFSLEQTVWPGISLRLLTVSMVAAGLYFLSRKAAVPGLAPKRSITYLHTFAATALLAFLAWYEAPGAWPAAVWAIFALVLALVDRKFELDDLRWQAHVLAALTMLRSVSVNLYISESWHGVSVRLLSVAIVVVVMYALSQLIRMSQDGRMRERHHIYSWAASALVSLLMWYELQPLSVAIGWAVFGLVLFEYGLLRKVRQFRFQAYLASLASFGRIFFANLGAGHPGEFWGPQVYTVAPLTLIFFFVYTQLSVENKDTGDDRRLHFDALLCYLGTASVVAVLYFQSLQDWLVTAWAAAVLVLFGAAVLLGRPIFLHQGILLTVGTCVRGIMHNLFGASYFQDGDWTGRYFVLGSAVSLLLACLPFAFLLRDRQKAQTSRLRWLAAAARRPEQFMFFAPVLLLTLMLALKMRAGMVTVAWGIEGVLIVLLALAINERSFRLTGLALLLVCVGKIMVRDAWGLAARDRYITFIILGGALLLVSFLYSKYREAIRQLL